MFEIHSLKYMLVLLETEEKIPKGSALTLSPFEAIANCAHFSAASDDISAKNISFYTLLRRTISMA